MMHIRKQGKVHFELWDFAGGWDVTKYARNLLGFVYLVVPQIAAKAGVRLDPPHGSNTRAANLEAEVALRAGSRRSWARFCECVGDRLAQFAEAFRKSGRWSRGVYLQV